MRRSEKASEPVRSAEEVLLSDTVAGELMYGFRRATHFERNAAVLRLFLDSPYSSIIEVGTVTADRYARKAPA